MATELMGRGNQVHDLSEMLELPPPAPGSWEHPGYRKSLGKREFLPQVLPTCQQ